LLSTLSIKRRWYISIIPPGCKPGTTQDIDFYSIAHDDDDAFDETLPPSRSDWETVAEVAGSAPTRVYPYIYDGRDENN